MSGGSCLGLMHQTYKSWQFRSLAKQLPLQDVSRVGVFFIKYIPKKNKLEHQQLNDLLYLYYNYLLKDRYIDLVQLFKYYSYFLLL